MAIGGSSPSKEAVELIELAQRTSEKLRENPEEVDTVAALCALAIKKAGVPYPEAESLLARCLLYQGKDKEALRHANIALEIDPCAFGAQMVFVLDALSKVKETKLRAGDFIGTTGSGDAAEKIVTGVITTIFTGLFSLGRAGHSALTQADFKKEVLKLVDIYRKLCSKEIDEKQYLGMSDVLLSLGDTIKDMPMPGEKPNLYDEIVKVPLSNIILRESRKKVTDIRYLAEGKSVLMKK